MNVSRIFRSRTICVFALLALVLLTVAAEAQPDRGRRGRGGWGRFGAMMAPEFVRRDLQIIEQELTLDETQAPIVEVILDDYDAAFTIASEAIRDDFSALRPQTEEDVKRNEQRREIIGKFREIRRQMRDLDEDPSDDAQKKIAELRSQMEGFREQMVELRPPMPEGAELERLRDAYSDINDRWTKERAALRLEFLTNLQVVMNDTQLLEWDAFLRTLRRSKSLGQSRISGEGVDLIVLLREAGLSEEEEFEWRPLTDAYAIALDRALVDRDEFTTTSRAEMISAFMNRDFESALKVMEREVTKRIAVRNVNDSFVEQFTAELDEERGETFRSTYFREAYSRIFRSSRTDQAFRVALEMTDLSDDQRTDLVALQAAFEEENAVKSAQLLQLTRRHEPMSNVERMRGRIERMNGGEPADREDPVRDGFRERTDMEIRYRNEIEARLTPEQIELLPEAPQARREMRDGRRNREEFMKRFDKNGDGELNEQEREAARQARRADRGEGRGGGFGGGGGRGDGRGGGRPDGGRGNRNDN